MLLMVLPYFYPFFISQKKQDVSAFEKDMAALKIRTADSSQKFSYKKDKTQYYSNERSHDRYDDAPSFKGTLFEFDPNTINAGDWKRLGLRDKTIATIQNYLNKGGKFYKAEDIKKIWGLHENEVQRLLPYIRIAPKNDYTKSGTPAFEKTVYKKEFHPVDINTADSLALVELPGIGAGFAKRMLNFRSRLGGFVSVQQISETYGLPDSTFQKIKNRLIISNTAVKQININTATIDEMKTHPYIRYQVANAIVQYRLQHGNYLSVSDIKKIMLVTDDIFAKASPYLTVQ
jgi:DNA uptake protein ComE-like DNA-binding protein